MINMATARRLVLRYAQEEEACLNERYTADDPAALASEIERALMLFGSGVGADKFTRIEFFEGELRVIVRALREALA